MERKWYYHTLLAKLNDDEPTEVSDIQKCYCYLTEEEVKEKTSYIKINSFDSAVKYSQGSFKKYIRHKPKTWYRKKEKLSFRVSAYWWLDSSDSTWFTKETFESYAVYDSYTILDIEHHSLEEIMRHSSAEDFLQYLKDKEITSCPIMIK